MCPGSTRWTSSKHVSGPGTYAYRRYAAIACESSALAYPRHFLERLGLGGERKPPPVGRVVERLHPEPVADEHEALPWCVPDRDREHPVEVVDEVQTMLLVEMEDRLAVPGGLEPVTRALELGSQRAEVVDLSVEDQPERVVFVGERLVARRPGR